MQACFFSTVPKDESGDYRNEDVAFWLKGGSTLALSDGASVSFDSARWAKLLTRQFIKNPIVNSAWLTEAISSFHTIYNREQMGWSAQAAFDRGSFASLLGVQYDELANTVNLFGIGDTVAILMDGEKIIDSFPLTMVEQFGTSPTLFSTNQQHNAFFDDPNFMANSVKRWALDSLDNPAILCMTDALAHWFIQRKEYTPSPYNLLQQVLSKEKFAAFVKHARACGEMKVDDTTIIALTNDKLSFNKRV